MAENEINLANYYRRDIKKEELLAYIAGRPLQAAELNDMQEIIRHQNKRLFDRLFSDGAIQSGGVVAIEASTGATRCGEAEIYLRGRLRTVAAADLIVPTRGHCEIGVWLEEQVVEALHDPSLRDPAEGTRAYDQEGAARLRLQLNWGLSTDGHRGSFYRLYEVEDGVIKQKTAPTNHSNFANALARYDRDNNGGHYVIDGLSVVFTGTEETDSGGRNEVYSLLEGKAHVYGHEVELPTARRLRLPFDPDLYSILSEPHQFRGDGEGKMRINVDRAPIERIQKIDITAQKTATIVHGSYSGAADSLPDNSVIEIVAVAQGSTRYAAGSDYSFSAGQLDWSPGGAEPAPGSSYQVTYKHIIQTTALDADERGFTVKGAVDGSLVLIDYQCRLPRTDLLALDREGQIIRIKGQARRQNPKAPVAPSGMLELAQLRHRWFLVAPTEVGNSAIVAVPMSRLQSMQRDIFDLQDLVALERLRTDALADAPAATRGIFVDSFLNDNQRDLGVAQTAAIVDGVLTLPIRASTQLLDSREQALTLPYRPVVLIEQTARTGISKINPYSAFDPVPATVQLTPAVDYWTETEQINGAHITRTLGGGGATRSSIREERRTVATKSAEFLRPLTISFRLEGFLPDEPLREVIFDGLKLAAEPI